MTKIRMAFFDNDGYMNSFVGYLCKKCRNIIEARIFTDIAMLEEQIKKGGVDVLLAAEELQDSFQIYADRVPQIIFLSEGNRIDEKSTFPVIFKYQAVPEIIREIFELLAENDRISYHSEIISKRTVEMIGGYAPFGGGGVTKYLLHIAERSAKKEKVLYVSLEEFQGFSYLWQEKKNGRKMPYSGMSEVLFYLRQNREKLALKLESVLYHKNGLDYIFPVEDYRDLHSMVKEDMIHFLKVLQEQTEYEKVIFDIGFLCEASIYLMENCEKIYMPEPEGQMQSSKMAAFEKNLRLSGKEMIMEKKAWIKRNLPESLPV